jgi:hypothetical protein
MRLPVPWLLALVVVLGSATVYIYINIIAPPIVPAVAPSTTTATIPAGQWYIVGPVSGNTITINSNVSANILIGVGSAVAVVNSLPSGFVVGYTANIAQNTWAFSVINYSGVYAVGFGQGRPALCMAGSISALSNGLYLITPTAVSSSSYSTYSSACSAIGAQYVFNGTIEVASGPYMDFGTNDGFIWPGLQFYYQNTTSATLSLSTYEITEYYNQTNYYWYIRPAVWIAVSPSANAEVTITVSTST